jgi:DNA repair exonuclease SbcCD ATPase subunit
MDNVRQIRTRAPALTQAEVDKECDAFIARNDYPTVRTLAATLKRGSFSTLDVMLKDWEERHRAPVAPPIQPSQELAKVFEKEVSAAIAQERAAHSDTVARLQDNKAAIVEESKQQAAQIDELQAETEALAQEKLARDAELAELKRSHEALERDNKQRVEEIAQARIRLEDLPGLKDEIGQLHAQLAEEKAKTADIDKRAAVLESQRDALTEQLARETEHSAGLQKMLDATQADQRAMRIDFDKRLAEAAEVSAKAIVSERTAAQKAGEAAQTAAVENAAKAARLEAAEAMIKRLQEELQKAKESQAK